MALIRSSAHQWVRSDWLARQVAAATPLLRGGDRRWVYARVVNSGLLNALGVLAHCDTLRSLSHLDIQLESYLLHPPSEGHSYPFQKVLIGRLVLQSKLAADKKKVLHDKLATLMQDKNYSRLLKSPKTKPESVTAQAV